MKTKRIISLSVLLAGLVVGGGAFIKTSFTHERFVVVRADEGDYYASITDNMEWEAWRWKSYQTHYKWD